MAKQINEQLSELERLEKADLKDRWVKLTGRSAPKLSAAMLRLAISYELQSKALGGLTRKAKQHLAQSAAGKTTSREISPGMRLVREHGGKVHFVTIGENGEILWNGKEWNSLSEVARAITGTRWSGPAFFGLRNRASAA
jgi:hypothetical protein